MNKKINLLSGINVHCSWREFVMDKDVQKEIKKIESFLSKENDFFPHTEHVLRFLENNLNNLKVVILGMDPYPSVFKSSSGEIDCVATGRSFEIKNVLEFTDKYRQTSLRNIFKNLYLLETNAKDCKMEEIREDVASGKIKFKTTKEFFCSLEQQGVLFLNATLTVEPNKPNSHKEIWEPFINKLLYYIESKKSPLWELWGMVALNRLNNVVPKISYKHIYFTKHPRLPEFVHSDSFKKIKDIGINCNIFII